MKRERVKELLEVYTAYANGRDIQWRREASDHWSDFPVGEDCNFLENIEYRIKPEPQYMLVPFDPWTGKIVNGTVNVYDFPPNERTIESFRNRMASGYDVKVIVV